jgi:hypothetical protein
MRGYIFVVALPSVLRRKRKSSDFDHPCRLFFLEHTGELCIFILQEEMEPNTKQQSSTLG